MSWFVAGVLDRHDPLEERLLRRVEVLHEVDDAAGVLERLVDDRIDALVTEADLEALVEERHLCEALEDRLGAELGLFEDRRVGPERDGGAASFDDPRRAASLSCGLPPFAKSARTCRRRGGSRARDGPTARSRPTRRRRAGRRRPCSRSPPNLPPAWSTVSTTSAPTCPCTRGASSMGMPRPLSMTRQPPSGSSVTSMCVHRRPSPRRRSCRRPRRRGGGGR